MLSPPDTQADLCHSINTTVTLQPASCYASSSRRLITNTFRFRSSPFTEHGGVRATLREIKLQLNHSLPWKLLGLFQSIYINTSK